MRASRAVLDPAGLDVYAEQVLRNSRRVGRAHSQAKQLEHALASRLSQIYIVLGPVYSWAYWLGYFVCVGLGGAASASGTVLLV
jgi:hypothetical protein